MSASTDVLPRQVETWHRACGDLVALVRDLSPEDGALPTDLPGWTVHDVVAHVAHLEAVVAGAPEETVEVPDLPHVVGPMGVYCEQGVLARKDRSLGELADELEDAVARRYAELLADPPTDPDAPAPRTPGRSPWSVGTLLRNRPFDVWIHEQDVRRAVGRPGGWGTPAAALTLGVLAASLSFVVGKRLAPPAGTTVAVLVPEASLEARVRVGEAGRPPPAPAGAPADVPGPLSAADFRGLGAGRRTPDQTAAEVEGDQELGSRLLGLLAVTP